MTEKARKQRNAMRCRELYPIFATRIRSIIKDMEALGERPRIQDAWRSEADQLKAYHDGFSLVKYGFHNITGPGGRMESLAADCLDDNYPVGGSPTLAYYLKLAWVARQHNCRTGICFSSKKAALTDAELHDINEAIATQNWKAKLKLGFDPTHIEPAELTIAQASAGQRPGVV